MDLLDVWKKLETEKLEKPVLGSAAPGKKSKHPVQKLKEAYLTTSIFAVVFLIVFVFIFFQTHEVLVKSLMALVIVAYIFFFVINISMFSRIQTPLPVERSLREVLQHTHTFISDNIRFQERVALYIYPVAGAAGFFLGGSHGTDDFGGFLEHKSIYVILVITLAVLTPLCFYLTRWMYKISYGKCLTELKLLIDELNRPD
jgi:hypothetical protein